MDKYPINIKIKFGSEIVTLQTTNDRVKTKTGVEIYMQQRQSDWRPWAIIPDGTLEKHKHDKPKVIKVDWIEL